MASHPTTIKQCTVCNSKMRTKIEELYISGLKAPKIIEYLKNISDPKQKLIVEEENISQSALYRHLNKHFSQDDITKVAVAEVKARAQESRSLYQQGVEITIDKINTLNHMIDMQLINIEELEKNMQVKPKERHQLTIAYMGQVRGYIETLGKLTGDLRQEGTIDINFFNGEIQVFADLVLDTIREIDKQMGLDGALERSFAGEFQNQWLGYVNRLEKITTGELTVDDATRDQKVNRFNQS